MDPLQAIEDALRNVGRGRDHPSTHPEGRSNWLERGVVSKARERFAVPITHVVVDLERERKRSATELVAQSHKVASARSSRGVAECAAPRDLWLRATKSG